MHDKSNTNNNLVFFAISNNLLYLKFMLNIKLIIIPNTLLWPLVRWSLYKCKYLWGVGGKGQILSF